MNENPRCKRNPNLMPELDETEDDLPSVDDEGSFIELPHGCGKTLFMEDEETGDEDDAFEAEGDGRPIFDEEYEDEAFS